MKKLVNKVFDIDRYLEVNKSHSINDVKPLPGDTVKFKGEIYKALDYAHKSRGSLNGCVQCGLFDYSKCNCGCPWVSCKNIIYCRVGK